MKINIRRTLLQLLFTVTALSLSHQAMAVSWQSMLRWISSTGARNLYVVASIPQQGSDVNQVTHLAATSLNPAPVPILPPNLQFHFYSLQNGTTIPPLTGSQLGVLHQPDTIPLAMAARWQWIPEELFSQYKEFKDKQDKDRFDRSGGGSGTRTIVR